MSSSSSPAPLRSDQIALRRQGRDLARWLIIVPVVLLLLFGCSHLALLAAPPLPSTDTRSKLQADYRPWLLATIPAISPAIVTEIVQDQATKVPNPVTVTASIWSTPEPTITGIATSETPNASPVTATSSTLSPTRTPTGLTTSTRTPTPKATVTLTRTPFPTFTRTATPTRTFAPIPTRTPTPVPTSTFTAVPPTNTSAPPPPPPATNTPTRTNTPVVPPTNTPTRTNTPVVPPSNTPTRTNTPVVPPSNTPTRTNTPVVPPSNTPTPTDTPIPPTNTPACLISAGGTGGGGSSFSWNLTNSGAVTVNLTSVSASWAQPGDVWQPPLDFGGSTVANGWPGINSPGGTVSTSGPVDLPPGSKSLSFNFNNLTPGVTYSVSASFDNGCTVNSSFTA